MQPIRVSILGGGMSFQTFHYPSISALSDKYVLHSVFARSNVEFIKQICGDSVAIASSVQDIAQDEAVDLVIISTPDTTHLDFTRTMLEAGKHVVVEKPLTLTSEDASLLQDIAKEKGLVLTVYQNRRWDSDFLTVSQLIRDCKMGTLNEFTSCYDRYRPMPQVDQDHQSPSSTHWKMNPSENEGAIYALGTHTIDQAIMLFGLPDSLFCRVWDGRGSGINECFDLSMYYPPVSGSRIPLNCHIRCNILSPLRSQLRFSVKGDRGSYTKYGGDPQCGQIAAGMSMSDSSFGIEPEVEWGELVTGIPGGQVNVDGSLEASQRVPSQRGDYLKFYSNLSDAIGEKSPDKLLVRTQEVICVLKIIELALQSSAQRKVLQVPNAWSVK